MNPLRWHPTAVSDEPLDFVHGMHTIVVNRDPDARIGMAAHLALVNRSMTERACVDAHSELLLVPQQGTLTITTECGVLRAAAVAAFDEASRGCEIVREFGGASSADMPGVANCDFVVFPLRWMGAEDTFRRAALKERPQP